MVDLRKSYITKKNKTEEYKVKIEQTVSRDV